jgi:uncharacterized Zn-binding protein involved in type VI secretion
MPEAARKTDEIEHTSALTGLLTGLVVGVVVGAVIGATLATGGTAAIVLGAVVGASTGGSLVGMAGEWIGSMFTSPAGPIDEGLWSVRINDLFAARVTDPVACSKDGPMPIATGSDSVFIGGLPAARKSDKTVCGAAIAEGSPDVLVGGTTTEYLTVQGEIPPWARILEFVIGLPSLVSGGIGLLKLGVRALRFAPQLLRGGWDLLKAAPGLFSAAGRSIWTAVSKFPSTVRSAFVAVRNWCPRMCFASATLVSTVHGKLPIGEIYPGQEVHVFDFAGGRWQTAPVLARRDNAYSGTLLAIRTDNSLVEVTRDHPVWVVEGDGLPERGAAHGLRPGQDESGALPGCWVNAQDVRVGDLLLGLDGCRRPVIAAVEREVTAFTVCTLTVAQHPNYAVGEDSWLAHNASWCAALSKHIAKPQSLLNVAKLKGFSPSAIHAHHIVMKGGWINWNPVKRQFLQGSRDILTKHGIPLLDDVSDLKNIDPSDIKNMCWALNYKDGIHSQKYAQKVYEILKQADDLGGKPAVEAALENMAKILEKGKIFW